MKIKLAPHRRLDPVSTSITASVNQPNNRSWKHQFIQKQDQADSEQQQHYQKQCLLSCARLSRNRRKTYRKPSTQSHSATGTGTIKQRPQTSTTLTSSTLTSSTLTSTSTLNRSPPRSTTLPRPQTSTGTRPLLHRSTTTSTTTKRRPQTSTLKRSPPSSKTPSIQHPPSIHPSTRITKTKERPQTTNGRTRHQKRSPLNNRMPSQRQRQRPQTSSHPRRSSLVQKHPHFHTRTIPKGRWRLAQRLAILPGFQKQYDLQHTATTATTTTAIQFVHCSSKYTKWMKTTRRLALARSDYVADKRAMITDHRMDRILVATVPRAGQPMETELHMQARRLQRCLIAYLVRLKHASANIILYSYRTHRAKQIVQRLKQNQERNAAIVRKMFMQRFKHVFQAWWKQTVHSKALLRITTRFLQASNENTVAYMFERWQDEYYSVYDEYQKTIDAYHKYKRHTMKCKSLYGWIDYAWTKNELRLFVKRRLWKRWTNNVHAIVMGRLFGIQWQAALVIQHAYRNMRTRDKEKMREMKAHGDIVQFKQQRKTAATTIQCRVRINVSHRKINARRCVKHVLCHVVLVDASRKIDHVEYCHQRRTTRTLERRRRIDEQIHIQVHVLSHKEQQGYLPTWKTWPRKCWARSTKEGRTAMLTAKAVLHQNRAFDAGLAETFLLRTKTSAMGRKKNDKQVLKDLVETMRLEGLQEEARTAFQRRWPPLC